MGFEEWPLASKYALIGGIAVGCTILLILGRYFWSRRRQAQKAKQRVVNRSIEEPINEKQTYGNYPPRIATFAISGPLVDEDHKEEYARTASLLPAKPPASQAHPSEITKRPHPSELRQRQESRYSELSVVPTEFHLALRSPALKSPLSLESPIIHSPQPRSPGLQASFSYIDLDDDAGVSKPELAKLKNDPKRAPSRSPIDSPIESPVTGEGDLTIRVPRLYEPPSLAYGAAEVPYSPPKRVFPKSKKHYEPAVSLQRKRQSGDAAALIRNKSNQSNASSARKSRHRGARISGSSAGDWVDTLTMVDDQESAPPSAISSTADMIMPVQTESPAATSAYRKFIPHQSRESLMVPSSRNSRGGGSIKRTKSQKKAAKAQAKAAKSGGHLARNNALIADELAAIKNTAKRARSKSPFKNLSIGGSSKKTEGE
ncbi:hypothetical protein TWF694_008275 [Orbilia ellipsospora]|uniref:Uncharacterized protein n=1 Tax=Orbilia ellipsospora TaxID=2528407 RepID=A0AAV9XIZ7_9PEZI